MAGFLIPSLEQFEYIRNLQKQLRHENSEKRRRQCITEAGKIQDGIVPKGQGPLSVSSSSAFDRSDIVEEFWRCTDNLVVMVEDFATTTTTTTTTTTLPISMGNGQHTDSNTCATTKNPRSPHCHDTAGTRNLPFPPPIVDIRPDSERNQEVSQLGMGESLQILQPSPSFLLQQQQQGHRHQLVLDAAKMGSSPIPDPPPTPNVEGDDEEDEHQSTSSQETTWSQMPPPPPKQTNTVTKNTVLLNENDDDASTVASEETVLPQSRPGSACKTTNPPQGQRTSANPRTPSHHKRPLSTESPLSSSSSTGTVSPIQLPPLRKQQQQQKSRGNKPWFQRKRRKKLQQSRLVFNNLEIVKQSDSLYDKDN